jgi:hypothetical protein
MTPRRPSRLLGFAVLIARMKDEPPNGDGWDDGAVV